MTKPIYITYTANQDPVEVLEAAMKRHGDASAFILVPTRLWSKLVPEKERNKHEVRELRGGHQDHQEQSIAGLGCRVCVHEATTRAS